MGAWIPPLARITHAPGFRVQVYRPRKGKTHLVVGAASKRVYCGKVGISLDRIAFEPADLIDCRYCVNFASGRAKALLLECFPDWLMQSDSLRYLHQFLNHEGRLSDARIVRVYYELAGCYPSW